jgi:hypothetical protein
VISRGLPLDVVATVHSFGWSANVTYGDYFQFFGDQWSVVGLSLLLEFRGQAKQHWILAGLPFAGSLHNHGL